MNPDIQRIAEKWARLYALRTEDVLVVDLVAEALTELDALRDTQERELREILSTGPEDERTLLEMVREERNLSEELAGKCNDLIEFVEHAAKGYCHCQMNGPDVDHNRHRASCRVGKAQKFLGIKMEEIE